MIFTRDDRAGEGKLSSRLGLVTDAVEAADGFDFYAYLVAHLSKGGRCDYVIADEAQFLAPDQIDQLARVVDDLDLDVFAFGITTDFRSKLFPGSQRLSSWPTASRSSRSRRSAGAGRGPRTTRVRAAGRWWSRARRSWSVT